MELKNENIGILGRVMLLQPTLKSRTVVVNWNIGVTCKFNFEFTRLWQVGCTADIAEI